MQTLCDPRIPEFNGAIPGMQFFGVSTRIFLSMSSSLNVEIRNCTNKSYQGDLTYLLIISGLLEQDCIYVFFHLLVPDQYSNQN